MFGEIDTISARIRSRTCHTFNHKSKGKWKGEQKLFILKWLQCIAWASWGKIATLLIYRWTDATVVLRDVLHALIFWGRLVSSNGGWIYEHATKRVVVGLIPLKLHPKRFWKKGNLVKIKRNNLKWYISSYLCPKNDLPGRWVIIY